MYNILMRFLRESRGFTQKAVAEKLGVSTHFYQEIECGKILLTAKQASQLGELYHAHSSYFSKSAGQLDFLLAKIEQAKILKKDNDRLKRQLKQVGIIIEE
ncbi:helix-turn-helix domain-containing protein [Flavitalea flava]